MVMYFKAPLTAHITHLTVSFRILHETSIFTKQNVTDGYDKKQGTLWGPAKFAHHFFPLLLTSAMILSTSWN